MSRSNKEVTAFEQTRRFTGEDIDRARPGEDYDAQLPLSNQVPYSEFTIFKDLYTDSGLIIDIFRKEKHPDPADMLADYQEMEGVRLSDNELHIMLSWMDDLCQKALRHAIKIEDAPHEEPAPPRPDNPGIVTVTKKHARAS